MDIFNRPPSIAEDTLQYHLSLGPSFNPTDKSSVSALATLIDSFVKEVLPNHIWNRDAFEVKVVRNKGLSVGRDDGDWELEGRMRVGDCVDDEWCVVWLLREISKRWDVAVSVYDSDGEFLLIEAAEYLPDWITPENADNRVWIYQDHLHIVPIQYISAPNAKREKRRAVHEVDSDNESSDKDVDSHYISSEEALKLVRNPKIDTLAPKEVEQAALRRIENYPAAARQHIHKTNVYLPKEIALALRKNPSLVQKAVETFYTRDASQMRAAARMARFTPEPSVLTTVTMTRTAYAQLMGQKFHPPRIFGQWKEKEGTPEWRRKDIGMKIACGFEMVYQESKNRKEMVNQGISNTEASIAARKETLRVDLEYRQYIDKLKQIGFFKGELEGSAGWNALETQAAYQFITRRQSDDASRTSFATLVNSAISDAQLATGTNGMDTFAESGEEDSDEWLTINENMMEDILRQAHPSSESGRKSKADKMDVDVAEDPEKVADRKAEEQASNLKSLAEKVEKFVGGKGDVEGATFEDELLSDEEDPSEFSEEENGSDQEPEDVSMGKGVSGDRQAAMDKLVPALDPSEYGQMPASFHSNSQKVREELPQESEVVQEKRSTLPSEPAKKPMRPLIFPRDQFDGVVDSDDESEEELQGQEDEDEEDQPTVVGDIEVDMNEEEEEFLKFSREVLGISSDMWDQIVQDRKDRGAFLPKSALKMAKSASVPLGIPVEEETISGTAPLDKNNDLMSFEAVMEAMDAELARIKQSGAKQLVPQKGKTQDKGKQKATESDDEMDAMDAEFRAAIQNNSDGEEQEGSMDYTMMKNFLESFKSQQGLSGPVSNLIGRLGGQLPRDDN